MSPTGKSAVVLAMAAALLAAGCRKASEGRPSVAYTRIDPATAGAIEGTIRYAKTPPARVAIDMAQDPACAVSGQGTNFSEEYVVHDGGLANVFVYVKSGLGDKVYRAPATPVVLDQEDCRYVPHVIGVMAGQPVEFRTADSTMHNINVQPAAPGNSPFNTDQGPKGSPVRHTFAQPETMIPVRCNYHPWMQAFINVAANPFFAVSDGQGHYEIHGLPPGIYTLAADQEKLGVQERSVTVAPRQTARVDLTYGKD